MFKFITKKPLWVNFLFAIALMAVILVIFMLSLNFITHHGETLAIPNVTGKTYQEALQTLEGQGFDVEIQDSVYNDTAKPLIVLRQFPDTDAVVKIHRTVYLTINRAVPPAIEMPMLENLSFRNAEMLLQQYGLRLKDTVYKADFARNSVLEQLYNGQRIKPGAKINMGSEITLVLGSGLGAEEFPVPDLVGHTFAEAQVMLESNNLALGGLDVASDVTDTANAFVYRQSPSRTSSDGRINRIRPGQLVMLSLQAMRPVRPIDSTALQPGNDY
ncbi:MAG TPA: PASTA domain-containing protein [Chitinophagaceae bacterium]|nr:PASTA domain-containing protein [Chitinophagaceae bacterium]